MKNVKTPVEAIINIQDPTIMWYRIPGFPGYEISTNGFMRSFKSRKKYRYGNLIRCVNNKFIISNSNNQRIQVSPNELWNIIRNANITPVHTWETEDTSRNPRYQILPDANVNVGKLVSKPKAVRDEPLEFADFSKIPDIPLE